MFLLAIGVYLTGFYGVYAVKHAATSPIRPSSKIGEGSGLRSSNKTVQTLSKALGGMMTTLEQEKELMA